MTDDEWEYGFYDSEYGGPNYWYCFGLPFKTPEMAKHTGDKSVIGHVVLVKRRPGSSDFEHVHSPHQSARDGETLPTARLATSMDAGRES